MVTGDDAPTVIEPARAVDRTGSGTPTPTSDTGTGTGTGTGLGTGPGSGTIGTHAALGTSTVVLPKPETILRRAAFEQTKRTAVSGVLFNALGLVFGAVGAGDPFAVRLFIVAMALGVLNNGWLLVVCRDVRRYRQRYALVYFAIATVSNAGVLLYLGTFGPILVMFVLNVYTACLAYNRKVARLVLYGALLPFVVLATLVTTRVVPDPGIVTLSEVVGTGGRAFLAGSFVVFLVMTYAQARKTRDLMVGSLLERDQAVRLASHREALLLEARGDLERALQAGGLGRFSEQTLGSFKLGAIIGRGGMGEVYDAIHVESGEAAAVKMLLPEVLGRADYVRRFLREVRIAASLDSPHVVRVLEVGDETAAVPYLAMERLRGEDLAQILRRKTRMDLPSVVDMVRQIARGVVAADEAGIVHRDLKPQNLFLAQVRAQGEAQGEPATWKILDFGVSKLASDDAALTKGEAIGTPRYMAPEQARGEKVDTRADVYALGAIAYRALTGRPPFSAEDGAPVILEVLSKMPARPGAIVKVPGDVDLALAIALAKRREDRYESAAALAEALDAAMTGRLPSAQKEKARALLEKLPWGAA
jgi:hypothetical protein